MRNPRECRTFADKCHAMPAVKSETGEDYFKKLFSEENLRQRLSATDFETFNTQAKITHFQKGDILFEEQETAKYVYFLQRGTAKLSKVGAYGKEQILRFIQEGDLVGYRSLLCGEVFQARAEAMTEIVALQIPGDFFMQLLQRDVQLSFAMLQKIAFELGESSNTITFLAQKTVRERLAEILLLLEKKLGTDPEGFIQISLTREEIANLIGTATESAIRLISEFKNDKLIETEGRNIKVLNREKLMKLGHIMQ